ncbi:hypothetical protein FBU30_010184 [Linnemannia zychae]|nr:hypothetical protein FBU30_010184 [Linnemannia zychae]
MSRTSGKAKVSDHLQAIDDLPQRHLVESPQARRSRGGTTYWIVEITHGHDKAKIDQ